MQKSNEKCDIDELRNGFCRKIYDKMALYFDVLQEFFFAFR